MIATLTVALVKFFAAPNIRWLGCDPEPRKRIYFANHTSHLDAVVLWAALPPHLRRTVRPVAARDYWTRNAIRLYFARTVFRSVLIEREKVTSENNSMDSLIGALQEGSSLIIFPEGTRGTGIVQKFKSGLFHLARKCPNAELVPVHIDNMNRILPKGEILAVPLMSCISFGKPLKLMEGESKLEFLERARASIVSLEQ